MASAPFPNGATDGDVFFHNDKVCLYHKISNTWECRTIGSMNLPDATSKRIQQIYGSRESNRKAI